MLTDEELQAEIRAFWCDGYQSAVNALRLWAETFGTHETKPALLRAAGMIELAKPGLDKFPLAKPSP